MNVIDEILNEWSYRCHDGIVDVNDPKKLRILKEILDENGIDLGEARPKKIKEPELEPEKDTIDYYLWVLKNEAIQSFGLYPAPTFANLAINLNPGHISSLYVWLDLAGKVLWGTNPSTDSGMAEDSIVLPPGSAFALKQGPTPFGIGFSGDEVKTPVLAPIYAGTNLLCYPYLAPLKLSPEWSAKNKFESKTKSRSSYDIIAVKKNGKDEKYALYPWFGFGSYGVWQKIDPINGSWSQPPRYLKMISPGEGFYFITSKNYPSHTFSTP